MDELQVSNPTTSGLAANHNEASALVQQMSLQEKAAFASGKSFWYLEANERLGIASIMVTDGPHGLRKQQTGGDHVGLAHSVPATCFPTASALAASWDLNLIYKIGVALGEQCVAEDVAVLLGPGMNIKRHPLCGRNFEYFSEDPLLTGELAAAFVHGVQSQGVGTSVKHFAVNNQEYGRMFIDAIVDERTLREIYLRGFEIAIRHSQPWTVMCAYNKVNGTYCGEHDWLLNQVLRDEWGFEGLVVTDWGATNNRVAGVKAGLDLEMPGSGGINDRQIAKAIATGQLTEKDLDQAIIRNVSLALCGSELTDRDVVLDQAAHHLLARRAATESAVLLKNDHSLLPLATDSSFGVIGAFAKQPRYQGAGSSQVVPTQLDCAYDAIASLTVASRIDASADVAYAPGYGIDDPALNEGLIAEAVTLAQQVAVPIVFAGLPAAYESEGFDREHMRMPDQHNQLIEAVCAVNPNTVVVLANGSPVEMPWIERVQAVLEVYLAGQGGGGAIADLLFGNACPSGKLAETFPLRQQDVAADQWFPGQGRQVQYREGLYVGYRYFDSAQREVLFPFGHGLSYTKFTYANLKAITQESATDVTVEVKNSGPTRGAEIVQLYIHQLAASMYRPEQELKAFAKVMLDPGETKEVLLRLHREDFATYDVGAGDWVVEAGVFQIRVGSSSRDIREVIALQIQSDDPISKKMKTQGPAASERRFRVSDEVFKGMLGHEIPASEPTRPFHANSTLSDLRETWLGRQVRQRMEKQFKANMGLTNKSDPQLKKMFEEMMTTMPLRSFVLFGRGTIQFKQMHALIAVLNHEYIRFFKILLNRPSDPD